MSRSIMLFGLLAAVACGSHGSAPLDASLPDACTTAPCPCDLFGTSCGAGMKCVPAFGAAGNASSRCVPGGSAVTGQSCSFDSSTTGDSCAPGFVCLLSSVAGGSCGRICGGCGGGTCSPDTAKYCDPQGSSSSRPTFCTDLMFGFDSSSPTIIPLGLVCAAEWCDLATAGTSVTCPYQDPSGSFETNGKCYLGPGGPTCAAPGTQGPGTDCSSQPMATYVGAPTELCAPGTSCVATPGGGRSCQRLCSTSSECATGATCQPLDDPDVPTLGACR